MNIQFRNIITPNDEELIAEAEKSSYYSTYQKEISNELQQNRINNAIKSAESDNYLVKVIVLNEEIAGFLFFGITTNMIGFLYTIYVKNDFRRKGIAKKSILEFPQFYRHPNLHLNSFQIG